MEAEPKSIPEHLAKLIEGCSVYAEIATKYWLSCAVISIFALSAKPADDKVKLPFDLPELYKSQFYPFAFLLISILVIMFASVTAQAIRARNLINRFIYNPVNRMVFSGNIFLQDIVDTVLFPAINRVAPLAQVLQGKNQFFPEANEVTAGWKTVLKVYYAALKLIAAVILYGLPGYALYFTAINITVNDHSLWNLPVIFLWVAGIFAGISILTIAVMDIRYTARALSKIGTNKDLDQKEKSNKVINYQLPFTYDEKTFSADVEETEKYPKEITFVINDPALPPVFNRTYIMTFTKEAKYEYSGSNPDLNNFMHILKRAHEANMNKPV